MPLYDPSQIPSADEVNQAHINSDVDKSRLSQHHTLGVSATQASPGNHNHDGITSVKIKASDLDGVVSAANGLPTGGTAGQILAKNTATNFDATWIDNYTSEIKHQVKLGEAISKGQAVYVSSSNGTNMIVSKASNATEATSSKTMGLLETGGALNDFVYVVVEGLLDGLDTSSATAGDPVWLGTNGNLIYGLANKPVAPAHLVFIGIVTRVQSVNGEIFVKPQNGFELNEIHDVLISSKANGDLLQYESSTNLWKNKPQSTLTISPSQVTGTAVITTDSRLSDARTPTAHASTHASAGSDPISISNTQVSGLGTSSTRNVPATGNASSTEVVLGTDTRLTDSRTPTAHTHGNISNAGIISATVTATNPVKVLITDASNTAGMLTTTGANTNTFLRGDGTWNIPPGTYALPKATSTTLGGVELFDNTVQTTAANSVTTTAGRTYGLQLNAADQAVVNVPWVGFSNPMTTAGDIIYGGTSGTATRLAPSTTNGWVLTYDTALSAPKWAAASGGGGSFTGGTLTSNLTLTPGTTTVSPLTFQTGTVGSNLLTTAAAGAREYDGTVFYQTSNATTGRALEVQEYFWACPTAGVNLDFTTTATAKSIIDSATKGLTLVAGTTYEFELYMTVSHTFVLGSSQAGSFGLTFTTVSGSPSVGYVYQFDTGSNTTGFNNAITLTTLAQRTTGTQTFSAAITTGSRFSIIRAKGIIRVTGTGSTKFYPSVSVSATNADNGWVVNNGSFLKVKPVGNGTVSEVGSAWT